MENKQQLDTRKTQIQNIIQKFRSQKALEVNRLGKINPLRIILSIRVSQQRVVQKQSPGRHSHFHDSSLHGYCGWRIQFLVSPVSAHPQVKVSWCTRRYWQTPCTLAQLVNPCTHICWSKKHKRIYQLHVFVYDTNKFRRFFFFFAKLIQKKRGKQVQTLTCKGNIPCFYYIFKSDLLERLKSLVRIQNCHVMLFWLDLMLFWLDLVALIFTSCNSIFFEPFSY